VDETICGQPFASAIVLSVVVGAISSYVAAHARAIFSKVFPKTAPRNLGGQEFHASFRGEVTPDTQPSLKKEKAQCQQRVLSLGLGCLLITGVSLFVCLRSRTREDHGSPSHTQVEKSQGILPFTSAFRGNLILTFTKTTPCGREKGRLIEVIDLARGIVARYTVTPLLFGGRLATVWKSERLERRQVEGTFPTFHLEPWPHG